MPLQMDMHMLCLPWKSLRKAWLFPFNCSPQKHRLQGSLCSTSKCMYLIPSLNARMHAFAVAPRMLTPFQQMHVVQDDLVSQSPSCCHALALLVRVELCCVSQVFLYMMSNNDSLPDSQTFFSHKEPLGKRQSTSCRSLPVQLNRHPHQFL